MVTKKQTLENTKAFFKSKTIQSCLVIMLLTLLSLFGYTESNAVVQVIILVASAAGVYGRVVAEDKLTV